MLALLSEVKRKKEVVMVAVVVVVVVVVDDVVYAVHRLLKPRVWRTLRE